MRSGTPGPAGPGRARPAGEVDDEVRDVRVAILAKLVDPHAQIMLDPVGAPADRRASWVGRCVLERWTGSADVRNVHVTGTLNDMTEPTGAERYLARRLEDPEYRQAYEEARERIEQIDSVIRAFDARREELHLTKAELARRAGVKPEAIRRLFSAEKPNPTLTTLVALAGALELEIRPTPRRGASTTRARSAASGTRHRSA